MNLTLTEDTALLEQTEDDLLISFVVVRGYGLKKEKGLWVATDEKVVMAACHEFAVLAYTLRHGQSMLDTEAYTPDEYLALRDRLHQARIEHLHVA